MYSIDDRLGVTGRRRANSPWTYKLLHSGQGLTTGEFGFRMASSEVDQKCLGHFAASTSRENPFLSSMLYKILGLSVILSKKLLRARKLRRLDPSRDTKSLQLYHHIIWLSREGLVIVEQYILPMVEDYVELKVLAYKLRASFYHIFVLFHNQPATHPPGISSLGSTTTLHNSSTGSGFQATRPELPNRDSISTTPPLEGGPVGGGLQSRPPGFTTPFQNPKAASSFLLPALDYRPTASACFNNAAVLADTLLPGSHPLRLSVKLEYAAYLYDCLHDSDACRRLAKQAIADVYNAQEGMDDESFEDAAELVGILGKMVKRGGKTSSAGGSSTAGGTPAGEYSRSEGSRGTPTRQQRSISRSSRTTAIKASAKEGMGASPGVPDLVMVNPI
ncbi:hypothetical protein DTO282F9_3870 [Paecilomyces variotii]|nr:hypothetical protein DTO282E5_4330 [Paecilomyces variotii]KAJ9399247.1 hypothetical protein DTO282F9_3870 [Paecilomyces variotii]